MPEKILQLSKYYEHPFSGAPFNTVTLREPTYRDIYPTGLGFPYDNHPTRAGLVTEMHYEKIDEYVGRLAIAPESNCLGELVAADAIALQKAICGFFSDTAASNTTSSPESSSSTSDSTVTELRE